ncbi:CD1871A family CXXC motif-containing protein [Tepidibacter hydrothermalis]|uniref:CD1871A family CXXC motif-containing protein n=1 Tax=Tepidibacter hydrothermalis TaxID=3036126 RepID=A0ABY8EJM3_9FIRM|nr:CD1871A family CXXC motif-containing protein [Tepidibacter hydrothermalis]WFD11188.1 CD1871A family CXXC motif-containing protein [Tepidibacter hydrothermalis]
MKRYIRVGLLSTGLIFTVIGVCRGEAIKVLMKAVKICLECIGVG